MRTMWWHQNKIKSTHFLETPTHHKNSIYRRVINSAHFMLCCNHKIQIRLLAAFVLCPCHYQSSSRAFTRNYFRWRNFSQNFPTHPVVFLPTKESKFSINQANVFAEPLLPLANQFLLIPCLFFFLLWIIFPPKLNQAWAKFAPTQTY